jgi:hypothetical protein
MQHSPDKEPKDSLGKALYKKIRGAAGAPGRGLYNITKKPHDDYKMDKSNKEFDFLKTYNEKSKRGVPMTNKEHAQMQMFKDRK